MPNILLSNKQTTIVHHVLCSMGFHTISDLVAIKCTIRVEFSRGVIYNYGLGQN